MTNTNMPQWHCKLLDILKWTFVVFQMNTHLLNHLVAQSSLMNNGFIIPKLTQLLIHKPTVWYFVPERPHKASALLMYSDTSEIPAYDFMKNCLLGKISQPAIWAFPKC